MSYELKFKNPYLYYRNHIKQNEDTGNWYSIIKNAHHLFKTY